MDLVVSLIGNDADDPVISVLLVSEEVWGGYLFDAS